MIARKDPTSRYYSSLEIRFSKTTSELSMCKQSLKLYYFPQFKEVSHRLKPFHFPKSTDPLTSFLNKNRRLSLVTSKSPAFRKLLESFTAPKFQLKLHDTWRQMADGGLWLVAVVGGRICHLFGGGYNPGMLNHLSKLRDHSSSRWCWEVFWWSWERPLGSMPYITSTESASALQELGRKYRASKGWGGPCGISGVSGARLETKMISC